MTPRTNPDLIPGAPWWVNALVKFGAFGIIAALCGMMVIQNRETSTTLLASNLASVDRLPIIAEKISVIAEDIKNDSDANAKFMREHTTNAQSSRREMDVKLAAIDAKLALVQQELVLIRQENQKTFDLFIRTAERIMGTESKNAPAPPASRDGGA